MEWHKSYVMQHFSLSAQQPDLSCMHTHDCMPMHAVHVYSIYTVSKCTDITAQAHIAACLTSRPNVLSCHGIITGL